jgi:phage-related minor tail protein
VAEFAMTGEMNFEKLGHSILSTATKVIADMAVKELIGLLGGNVSGSGPGGFDLGGILGGMFGGGGGFLAGVFHEGGMVGSPTAHRSIAVGPQALAAAPRYHEGTPNTGLNTGEHVAVLRDNEAVIPLTRGRAVPVELGGTGGGTVINMPQNFQINTPDADSFRKSRDQISADMARAGSRALRKND